MGNREANLNSACDALSRTHVAITKRSSLYQTAPQDVIDQPWFINLVVEARTDQSAQELLENIRHIERELGRDRSAAAVPKGPRLIDIDILLFGHAVIQSPELTVPHPRMLQRRFVLEPLLEIAADLRHPRTNRPLRDYLDPVQNQRVRKLD